MLSRNPPHVLDQVSGVVIALHSPKSLERIRSPHAYHMRLMILVPRWKSVEVVAMELEHRTAVGADLPGGTKPSGFMDGCSGSRPPHRPR